MKLILPTFTIILLLILSACTTNNITGAAIGLQQSQERTVTSPPVSIIVTAAPDSSWTEPMSTTQLLAVLDEEYPGGWEDEFWAEKVLGVPPFGTDFGEERNPPLGTGWIIDRRYSGSQEVETQVYAVTKVGNQWWLAEHLRAANYVSGDPIVSLADPNFFLSNWQINERSRRWHVVDGVVGDEVEPESWTSNNRPNYPSYPIDTYIGEGWIPQGNIISINQYAFIITEGAYFIYPWITIDSSLGINPATGSYDYLYGQEVMDRIYGKLYNWYAVNDSRGLCPDDWRVPSNNDWSVLIDFLGGPSVAGGKLKGTRHGSDEHPRWSSPNNDATNEAGMNVYPAGQFQNRRSIPMWYTQLGSSYGLGYAWFWSSDASQPFQMSDANFHQIMFLESGSSASSGTNIVNTATDLRDKLAVGDYVFVQNMGAPGGRYEAVRVDAITSSTITVFSVHAYVSNGADALNNGNLYYDYDPNQGTVHLNKIEPRILQNEPSSRYVLLYYNRGNIGQPIYLRNSGFAVRCIKN